MRTASELTRDTVLSNLRGDLQDELAVWLTGLRRTLPDVPADVERTLDDLTALIERYGDRSGVLAIIGEKLIEYEEVWKRQAVEVPCGHRYDVACGCQVQVRTYGEVLHG